MILAALVLSATCALAQADDTPTPPITEPTAEATPATAAAPEPTTSDAAAPVLVAEPAFDVDAAIERGLKKKVDYVYLSDVSFLKIMSAMGGEGTEGFSVRISTPEIWVAQLAKDAAKKYMRFTRADLSPEDVAPVLRIVAYPDTPKKMKNRGLAESVEHIVIRDTNKGEAVQPISLEPFDDSVSNAFGAKVELNGARAVFDLAEVKRLADKDRKGEFLVTVVGSKSGEKTFHVKERHLRKLGLWR